MAKKITILGGGLAGLAAAYVLSEDHEVTVYQMGWRLGGKATSGRSPERADRIEEVGLHIMQGWYTNLFDIMKEVYAIRSEKGLDPNSPLQDVFPSAGSTKYALTPGNTTLFTEFVRADGGWLNWPGFLVPNDKTPGSPALPFLDMLAQALLALVDIAAGAFFPQPNASATSKVAAREVAAGEAAAHDAGVVESLFDAASEVLSDTVALFRGSPPAEDDLDRLATEAARLSGLAGEGMDVFDHLRALVRAFVDQLRAGETSGFDILKVLEGIIAWIGRSIESFSIGMRRLWVLLKFMWVNLQGIVATLVVSSKGGPKFTLGTINRFDYRAWLKMFGADEDVLSFVIVRFLYAASFANLVDGKGKLAAGTALCFFVSALGYKGSFIYQFMAGTGDTLLMPLYQVLRERGVKIELFHQVLEVKNPRGDSIDEVVVARQVDLADPTKGYDPAMIVATPNGDLSAWPAEPLWDQLDATQAKEIRERRIDLENPYADWKPVAEKTLVRGEDFDDLVLALPVRTLGPICASIIQNSKRWQDMVENVPTTATQVMQLWLEPSAEGMGFRAADWGIPPKTRANSVVYADGMTTWIDTSQVLWSELWPAKKPELVIYFGGPLTPAAPVPEDPRASQPYVDMQSFRVRSYAEQWINDQLAFFWPKGATNELPQGLDFSLLASTSRSAGPYERLEGQLFRANVLPSMQYTLATPGTARYRFKADGSGFKHLFLAGDWTDFGLNVGYMEGAAISGLQAAAAVVKAEGKPPRMPALPEDIDWTYL